MIFKDKTKLYIDTLWLMSKWHNGQRRKFSNEPYCHHPIRVSKIVYDHTHNIDMATAALLHDILEDTRITIEELEKKYSKKIVDWVKELTNDDDEIKRIGKTEYMSNKFSGLSNKALIIKLADRLDNVWDLGEIKEKVFVEKYEIETEKIMIELITGRKLSNIMYKLYKQIRERLELIKL